MLQEPPFGHPRSSRNIPELQERRDRPTPIPTVHPYHSIDWTFTLGALPFPQWVGSSTLSFVTASPGILRLAPQLSIVRSEGIPRTSYLPGLSASALMI